MGEQVGGESENKHGLKTGKEAKKRKKEEEKKL